MDRMHFVSINLCYAYREHGKSIEQMRVSWIVCLMWTDTHTVLTHTPKRCWTLRVISCRTKTKRMHKASSQSEHRAQLARAEQQKNGMVEWKGFPRIWVTARHIHFISSFIYFIWAFRFISFGSLHSVRTHMQSQQHTAQHKNAQEMHFRFETNNIVVVVDMCVCVCIVRDALRHIRRMHL